MHSSKQTRLRHTLKKFIYTDGLNEAENLQKERFGNDRLLAALRGTNFESAQQVIESMKQEVETFRSGAEPNDDLTMMCVCVGPQTKG